MSESRSSTVDHQHLSGQVQEILNEALEADTVEMKNYHIRRALQYRVMLDFHE